MSLHQNSNFIQIFIQKLNSIEVRWLFTINLITAKGLLLKKLIPVAGQTAASGSFPSDNILIWKFERRKGFYDDDDDDIAFWLQDIHSTLPDRKTHQRAGAKRSDGSFNWMPDDDPAPVKEEKYNRPLSWLPAIKYANLPTPLAVRIVYYLFI